MSNSTEVFNEISRKLSRETNLQSQLAIVVEGAMDLTNADAGTLYSVSDENCLKFEVVLNRLLEIKKQAPDMSFPDIPLYLENKEANSSMVVVNCVLTEQSIFIDKAYDEQDYNLSGVRKFDKSTGYHTHSLLTVPIFDFAKKIIGVIQLINAKEADDSMRVFNKNDQEMVNLFVLQTAFTLSSKILIDKQKALFKTIND
jgi:GAF domain-containing protein